MGNDKRIQKIKCPIFCSRNEMIEKINKAINETGEIKKKTYIAERLIEEANKLLSCKYFNEKKLECKICHYISNLRKRTAELIIKNLKNKI